MDNTPTGVGPYAQKPGAQRSLVEEAASDIAKEWRDGEDVVGPKPLVVYRHFAGLMSGAAATTGRLSMEAQPERWIIKLAALTSGQLVTIDLGNGDSIVWPIFTTSECHIVLPAFRRWITLTNGGGSVDVYYIVAGVGGPMPPNYDWL